MSPALSPLNRSDWAQVTFRSEWPPLAAFEFFGIVGRRQLRTTVRQSVSYRRFAAADQHSIARLDQLALEPGAAVLRIDKPLPSPHVLMGRGAGGEGGAPVHA